VENATAILKKQPETPAGAQAESKKDKPKR
jgi:hypothetical protein